jgi:hypothetical protein
LTFPWFDKGTLSVRVPFAFLTKEIMMDTGLIGKLEKAKRYVAEKSTRIQFKSLQVSIAGDNNAHEVNMINGMLKCDCDFFKTRGRCSHTIAIETILEGMLPPQS